MVYKKFIKRGGKTYGPYSYKSRKENGKVITEYLGKHDEKYAEKIKTKKLLTIFFMVGLIAVFSLVFFINYSMTGRVALQVENNYLPGENIDGNLKILLKHGELLPLSTKILIDNSGEISEFFLSDLISGDISEGQFYAEGTSVSGEGQGYGILGEKKIYPTIYFELQIIEKGLEREVTEITENVPVEEPEETTEEQPKEPIEEIPAEETPEKTEEIIEETEQPIEPPVETLVPETPVVSEEPEVAPSEAITESAPESQETESVSEGTESSESSAPEVSESSSITGEIISENFIAGEVSKENPFVYDLPDKQSAEIKENSVKTESKTLSETDIDLDVESRQAIVTTDYYESVAGFGADYLTDEKINLNIDLSKFGLIAKEGQLIIKLVYSDEEIATAVKKISVESIVPEENVTEIEQNITEVAEINLTEIENRSLLQYKAIAGKPVKWIKIVKVENESDLEIEIPKKANNISLMTGEEIQQALDELEEYENVVEKSDRKDIADGTITGMVSVDISENKGFLKRLIDWISSLRITGNVIGGNEIQDSIVETADAKIVFAGEVLNVSDGAEIAVAYYTEPSTIAEENLTNGKRITISADDEFNYTDILAYSLINKQISMNETSRIRLYWYSNDKVGEIKEGIVNENITEVKENKTEAIEEEINETEIPEKIIEAPVEEINQTVQLNESLTNNSIPSISEANSSEENFASITGQVAGEITDEEIIELNQSNEIASEQPLTKILINFTAYDLDEDGFADYVEWIVPHFSEQVYDLIYIVKAEHLDSNRTFISDIYDSVKSLDGNWSETINDSEYVRVTFEQVLDNTKDITIYARASCSDSEGFVKIDGTDVPCEIYLKKKRINEIRGMLG